MSEVHDEELGNVDGRREDDLPLSSVAAVQPNQELGTMGDDSASSTEVMSATTSATPAAAAATDGRRVEQFDDDVGPYRLPMGESDDKDNLKGYVEQIEDSISPDRELSHLTDGIANKTKKMSASGVAMISTPAKDADKSIHAARRVEQIDDGGIPDPGVMMTPTPAKDADKSKFAGRLRGVEQIGDDRTGPLPFPALESEAGGDNDMKVNKKKAKLEMIDDDGFPANPTEFEDDIDAKMRAKTNNYEQTAVKSDDEESILVPTNEEIEGEPEVVTRGVNDIRNRGNAVSHLRPLIDAEGTENVENGDPKHCGRK